MNIPLPPRGYWAQQAYGYEVDKQALPPADKELKSQVIALDKSAEELLGKMFQGQQLSHAETTKTTVSTLQKSGQN
jgi:hypothetical protein